MRPPSVHHRLQSQKRVLLCCSRQNPSSRRARISQGKTILALNRRRARPCRMFSRKNTVGSVAYHTRLGKRVVVTIVPKIFFLLRSYYAYLWRSGAYGRENGASGA